MVSSDKKLKGCYDLFSKEYVNHNSL